MAKAKREPEPPPGSCRNCEAPLHGEYCSACGQRDLPARMTLSELLREVVSETFELDGRIPRTLVPFLFKPGFLSREHSRGRRVRYTSPFRLFLAATLLWVAVSFVTSQREQPEVADDEQVIVLGDPERPSVPGWASDQFDAFTQLPGPEQARRVSDATRDALPKAALLLIPVFALWLKLLYVRRDYFYVEHLVFALHVHAFGFVVAAVGTALPGEIWGSLGVGVVLVYVLVALRRAYESRWWTSVARLLVLFVVHGLLLATVVMLLTLAGALL